MNIATAVYHSYAPSLILCISNLNHERYKKKISKQSFLEVCLVSNKKHCINSILFMEQKTDDKTHFKMKTKQYTIIEIQELKNTFAIILY